MEKRTCYICGKPMKDCYDKDASKDKYIHPNCMKIKIKSKLDIGDTVSYKFRKRDYPDEPVIFGKVRRIYETTFGGKTKSIGVSIDVINPETHPCKVKITTLNLSNIKKIDSKESKPEKNYCCICGARVGACAHTGSDRRAYRMAKPFFDEEKAKFKEKLIKIINDYYGN